ncbi:MAG: ATP-binding protein [Limnochordia bacterium]
MLKRLYSFWQSGYSKLVLTLLLMLLGCCGQAQAGAAQRAILGRLDLSDWNLNERKTVSLVGDWEFYWGQLLTPADFTQTSQPALARYVSVPGSWIKYRLNGDPLPSDGFATYRLVIDAFPDQPLSLKLPFMSSAYKLWVNGRLLAENGQVGVSRSGETAQAKPLVVDIPPGSAPLELVVQISNFHHYRGGMRYPILIGEKEWIHKLEKMELGLIAFLVGCLVFIAFYHMLFFAMQRNDRTSYYFGIFSFFVLVRLFFVGPILLIRIFPDYNWEIALKIEYVTTALLAPIFASFMYSLYPKEMVDWVVRALSYVAYLYIAIICVTPGRTFTMLMPMFQYLMAIGLAYGVYVLIRAVRNRREGSVILLCAFLFCTFTIFNDLLLYRERLFTFDLSPWGVVALMVAIGHRLAVRSAKNYQEIEALSERLIELDRAKDDFMLRTSHELRTPLAGIIGIGQTMLADKDTSLTREQRMNLQLIVQSGQRLTRLVNNILDFERLRHGDITLKWEEVDLRQLVGVVFSLSQPLVGSKSIVLQNEVPENLPFVWADADRLEQILINLVANAVHYTHEGSVTVLAEDLEDVTRISVIDTGIGVAKDQLPYVFDPFQPIKGDSGIQISGTGLCLSIVRTLVDCHGGQLSFESEQGLGTMVSFTIPHRGTRGQRAEGVSQVERGKTRPRLASRGSLVEQTEERRTRPVTTEREAHFALAVGEDQTQAESAWEDLGAVRILLVEDEEINLVVMQSQLKRFRAAVDIARNGLDALRIIENNAMYDLVVIDVMMPHMNGYELCRRIREQYTLFELPIIVVTARNRSEEAAAAFAAGANDYLGKPFDRSEFLSRVYTILRLQKAVRHSMEMAQQYAAERSRREWTETMHNLTVTLSATLDTEEVCRQLLVMLRNEIACPLAGAWTTNSTGSPQEVAVIKTGAIATALQNAYDQIVADMQAWQTLQVGRTAQAAYLFIPVTYQKEVLCDLLLLRAADAPFTQAEQETALAIATQAGLALDNARLYGELKHKVLLLRQMYEISSAVIAATESHELLLQVALGAQRTLNLDRVAVFVLEQNDQSLRLQVGVEGQRVMPEWVGQYDKNSILGSWMRSAEPYGWLVEEPTAVPAERVTAISDVPTSSAVLPLKTSKGALGLLYVDTHASGNVLTETLLESLALLANYAAMALERAMHEEMARIGEAQRALIAAEEHSKQEIAELLHGKVQTRLLVTWHRLGVVEQLMRSDPQRAATVLAEARAELEDLRENEIRKTSHMLHPSIIKVGLMPALRSLITNFEDLIEVSVSTAASVAALDDPAVNKIPENIRLVVYRVLEEAINNAYRHGGARHVQVDLDLQDDGLMVVIQDDGSGYDTKSSIPGLGFVNITARVSQAAGWWTIAGTPGVGTEVRMWLPLTPPPAEMSS